MDSPCGGSGRVLRVGSDLPVPEEIVFQSNKYEIRRSPDSRSFNGVGFRFSEKMDFPTELTILVRK